MRSDPSIHIELQGVTKRFGATLALDAIDLRIGGGEVHALVGENGAGKSTLGKLLAGIHRPDAGSLLVRGRPVEFSSPRDALDAGVTIMAQELSLLPERSVIDNVFLGIEDHTGPWVLTKRLRQRFEQLTESSSIRLPPDALVGSLSVGDQQKVEILRSLARSAELIVMDEPTARLSGDELQTLHEIVRGLADQGTTVVYVSHFLDEVLELATTVTVMRDGRVVRSNQATVETNRTLIEGMTGRTIERAFPPIQPASSDAPTVLEVRGLRRDGVFHDVSLNVRAGEIVALSGLVGSGRTEVVRAIAGADGRDAGEMWLDGAAFHPRSPADAIRAGIVMIPESRKDQGLVLDRSVRENITLPYLKDLRRFGLLSEGVEGPIVEQRVKDVGIRAAGIDVPAWTLSGGNQQKILFARALVRTPRVLIADEPTRGVDVGAKRAIYELLTTLASEGLAVLMVSSELEEVLGLAHRVYVMNEGRIVSEMASDMASEHALISAAFDADASEVLGADPGSG